VANLDKTRDTMNQDRDKGDQPRNPDPRQQEDPQDELRRRPDPIREDQDDLQKQRKRA
jgi:hypothetical protein